MYIWCAVTAPRVLTTTARGPWSPQRTRPMTIVRGRVTSVSGRTQRRTYTTTWNHRRRSGHRTTSRLSAIATSRSTVGATGWWHPMGERALATPAWEGAGRHRRPAVSGITAAATRVTACMVSEAPSSILRQCLKLQQVMCRLLT